MTDKIAATPGPWEWSGLQLLGDCNDDSCSPVLIAQGDPFDPSEADKALIAAAPDLLRLLGVMFDAYENGPSCYEDPEECGGFLGHAVDLREEDFSAIADLLNRLDPKPADMPLPRQRSVEE